MDYEQVVNKLILAGRLSEEEVKEVGKTIVHDEERKAVDMIHLALCKESHDEGSCKYYEEAILNTRWEKPSHLKWLGIARKIIKRFDMDYSNLMNSMSKCCEIINKLGVLPGSFEAYFTAALLLDNPDLTPELIGENSTSSSNIT